MSKIYRDLLGYAGAGVWLSTVKVGGLRADDELTDYVCRLDCSSWSWLVDSTFAVRFELAWKVTKHPVQNYVGFISLKVVEGHYEADERVFTGRGVRLHVKEADGPSAAEIIGLSAVTTLKFTCTSTMSRYLKPLEGWQNRSKPLLEAEDGTAAAVPDGSGLDVHLETTLEVPRADPEMSRPRALRLEQRAEVVFGPRAQQKYMNLSLPVGLSVGAVLSPQRQAKSVDASGGSAGTDFGPVSFFARFSVPGLQELRGWRVGANLDDARAGAFSGQVQRPWGRKDGSSDPGQWFLQHLRTHGIIRLPSFVGDGLASASDRLAAWSPPWSPGARSPEPQGRADSLAPRPAVVPATRLRLGSDGGGAALGLESAQSGLGGPGWNGVVEVGRQGWGTRVSLAAGSADEGIGQPRYTLTAHSPWNGRTSL
ncbi:unnamed protein product, partial [Polarella glacialis]